MTGLLLGAGVLTAACVQASPGLGVGVVPIACVASGLGAG
jgi:hypothetical protein